MKLCILVNALEDNHPIAEARQLLLFLCYPVTLEQMDQTMKDSLQRRCNDWIKRRGSYSEMVIISRLTYAEEGIWKSVWE